jgi:hypothetical protein
MFIVEYIHSNIYTGIYMYIFAEMGPYILYVCTFGIPNAYITISLSHPHQNSPGKHETHGIRSDASDRTTSPEHEREKEGERGRKRERGARGGCGREGGRKRGTEGKRGREREGEGEREQTTPALLKPPPGHPRAGSIYIYIYICQTFTVQGASALRSTPTCRPALRRSRARPSASPA